MTTNTNTQTAGQTQPGPTFTEIQPGPVFLAIYRRMVARNDEIARRIEAAKANMPPLPDYIWEDTSYIANPETAPFPWMTDRITLIVDNAIPPNSTEKGTAIELIQLVFTDKGAIFEIDDAVRSGWLEDKDGVKHIFYGSSEALEAAGATNIE